MGYGRAGWYSYDRMDMRGKSADVINKEWQTLKVGDILLHRHGGEDLSAFGDERTAPEHDLLGRDALDVLVPEQDLAGRGPEQAGDGPEER